MKTNIFLFLFLTFCLYSCASAPKENNFTADSDLLKIPYYSTFFYYPDTTSKEQRLAASEKYMPSDVLNFLKSKEENLLLLQPDLINPVVTKTVPNTLDVIASSVADLKRGDYQKAIEKNKNILNILERNRTKTLDEDYGVTPFREAMLILELAYFQAGDEEQSLQILEKLIITANTWAPVYLALAEYYYNKKAFNLSMQVASKGIDKCSNDLLHLYLLQVKSSRELGQFIGAKQIINRVEVLFPKSSEMLLWKGIIYQDDKDYIAACDAFNSAFEQDRNNPHISHNHVYCLIQSNQLELASDILSVAITNYPSFAMLYYLNGFLENKRKNYLAAYKSWETYLSLIDENDPNYRLVNFKLTQMEHENVLETHSDLQTLPLASH